MGKGPSTVKTVEPYGGASCMTQVTSALHAVKTAQKTAGLSTGFLFKFFSSHNVKQRKKFLIVLVSLSLAFAEIQASKKTKKAVGK